MPHTKTLLVLQSVHNINRGKNLVDTVAFQLHITTTSIMFNDEVIIKATSDLTFSLSYKENDNEDALIALQQLARLFRAKRFSATLPVQETRVPVQRGNHTVERCKSTL